MFGTIESKFGSFVMSLHNLIDVNPDIQGENYHIAKSTVTNDTIDLLWSLTRCAVSNGVGEELIKIANKFKIEGIRNDGEMSVVEAPKYGIMLEFDFGSLKYLKKYLDSMLCLVRVYSNLANAKDNFPVMSVVNDTVFIDRGKSALSERLIYLWDSLCDSYDRRMSATVLVTVVDEELAGIFNEVPDLYSSILMAWKEIYASNGHLEPNNLYLEYLASDLISKYMYDYCVNGNHDLTVEDETSPNYEIKQLFNGVLNLTKQLNSFIFEQ